jgi:rod shape-determining protein MreD
MRLSVYILIGVCLTILQSSILSFLPIEFFKPDFGVPVIIYATLFLGPHSGLIAAIVLGLFQEILSNAPNGSIIFTKLSIFIIATFLKNQLYIDSRYSFSYICSGFVAVESFLYLALSLLSRGETFNIVNVLLYTFPNAIFTGFLSMFVFTFIEHLNMRYLSRE